MMWIKPDFAGMGATNAAYIVSKGTSTANGWYFRRVYGQNQIAFRMGADSAVTPTLTDGVWTHIAAITHGTGSKQIDLYVNGVMVSNSGASATAVTNATNMLLGYSAGAAADQFKGTLDDVRIFRNDLPNGDLQAIYNRGFSRRYGDYALRADNNNRVIALLNGGAAAPRIQPSFQIGNWFSGRTPKYVYLNGTRLKPNTDYSVDSVNTLYFGSYLVMQLNKTLTGADQTLFIDDDDSTGFMGSATAMKGLTITATANDKIAIKNFADTVFGGASSGQWYLELDLNGWTSNTSVRVVDSGFGGLNVWKAAATSPNLAVSGSTNLVPIDGNSGRQLVNMKFSNTNPVPIYASGTGYLGPSNLTFTINDSSSTRLSLTMTNISLSGTAGTATLSKRWTIYPNGRIIGSYVLSSLSATMDDPNIDFQVRYNTNPSYAFGQTYADQNARAAWYGGDPAFHSVVGGVLSIKNNNGTFTGDASTRDADMTTYNSNAGGTDYRRARIKLTNALFNSGIGNITTNFFVDIGRDFTDSATADSMARDLQTPAAMTAITGSVVTNDALDFNADGFAEGDGAYTFAAASGIAQIKWVNSVASFSPAFRISSWTQGTLPEVVILDNQILTRGYQYNAYLNTATSEVVLQLNKNLAPGTHVLFISHKSGLAVTLNRFEAKDGEGVDTLEWTTQSEFENLGYHVWRRVALGAQQLDTSLAQGEELAGAGIANALMAAARTEAAKRAAAKIASSDTGADTLKSSSLSEDDLKALGYERITAKLIPGAPGGSSATTREYRYIDRSATTGIAYEYLLEAVDFNGVRAQYGPRTARPANPLATELYSNYPNPFNPITTLRFSLKEKIKVSLVIYDGRGRVVRTLIRPDKPMAAGKYRLIWDAKNEGGFEVPSGQYFYRFTAGRYVKTRKMILVK
jgi:hypothetical protein